MKTNNYYHEPNVIVPLTTRTRKTRGGLMFPFKLEQMLATTAKEGKDDIVSWLGDHHPNGNKLFKVHKIPEFVKEVLPVFFQQTKFKSFQRQLNLWGFLRINDGKAKGAYHHDQFIRDRPELVPLLTRVKAPAIRTTHASRTKKQSQLPPSFPQHQPSSAVHVPLRPPLHYAHRLRPPIASQFPLPQEQHSSVQALLRPLLPIEHRPPPQIASQSFVNQQTHKYHYCQQEQPQPALTVSNSCTYNMLISRRPGPAGSIRGSTTKAKSKPSTNDPRFRSRIPPSILYPGVHQGSTYSQVLSSNNSNISTCPPPPTLKPHVFPPSQSSCSNKSTITTTCPPPWQPSILYPAVHQGLTHLQASSSNNSNISTCPPPPTLKPQVLPQSQSSSSNKSSITTTCPPPWPPSILYPAVHQGLTYSQVSSSNNSNISTCLPPPSLKRHVLPQSQSSSSNKSTFSTTFPLPCPPSALPVKRKVSVDSQLLVSSACAATTMSTPSLPGLTPSPSSSVNIIKIIDQQKEKLKATANSKELQVKTATAMTSSIRESSTFNNYMKEFDVNCFDPINLVEYDTTSTSCSDDSLGCFSNEDDGDIFDKFEIMFNKPPSKTTTKIAENHIVFGGEMSAFMNTLDNKKELLEQVITDDDGDSCDSNEEYGMPTMTMFDDGHHHTTATSTL